MIYCTQDAEKHGIILDDKNRKKLTLMKEKKYTKDERKEIRQVTNHRMKGEFYCSKLFIQSKL